MAMEATRHWCDLPADLLSIVANRLGIIELLRFRTVCKTWESSASESTAEIESCKPPWLLIYGSGKGCTLLDENLDKKYNIKISELDNEKAKVIASNQGWLLVFNEGSMFFLCPFSGLKIELPKFPEPQLKQEHFGAIFSSSPLSSNCTVTLLTKNDDQCFEVSYIHRGDKDWSIVKCPKPSYTRGDVDPMIITGTYYDGRFYFFCGKVDLLVFDPDTDHETKGFVWYKVLAQRKRAIGSKQLPFFLDNNYLLRDSKDKLLLPNGVSMSSTCGTQMKSMNDSKVNTVILGETITRSEEEKATSTADLRELRGVWLHPRLYNDSSLKQCW